MFHLYELCETREPAWSSIMCVTVTPVLVDILAPQGLLLFPHIFNPIKKSCKIFLNTNLNVAPTCIFCMLQTYPV